MTLKERCPVIEFKDLGDERGKLVVIEGGMAVPFDIKRVFYIYEKLCKKQLLNLRIWVMKEENLL